MAPGRKPPGFETFEDQVLEPRSTLTITGVFAYLAGVAGPDEAVTGQQAWPEMRPESTFEILQYQNALTL